MLGIMPTIAANSYRHRIGRSYNKPQADLGYVEVNLFSFLKRLIPIELPLHARSLD